MTPAEIKFFIAFDYIQVGLVPDFMLWKYSKLDNVLRFWMCVKQSDIDVVTFASDLRAPFMVVSPEFAQVNEFSSFAFAIMRRLYFPNPINKIESVSYFIH